MRRVIVAGMRRSGSTWLYNILRLGCMQAGLKVQSPGFIVLDADVDLLKVHEPVPIPEANCILTSRRDLRDIAASAVRWKVIPSDAEAVEEYLLREVENHAEWCDLSHHEVIYEEIHKDKIGEAAKILTILGLHIDPRTVVQKVEALPAREEAGYDKTTLLWKNHRTNGTPGSYFSTLTPEVICMIEQRFKEWQDRYGYRSGSTEVS